MLAQCPVSEHGAEFSTQEWSEEYGRIISGKGSPIVRMHH